MGFSTILIIALTAGLIVWGIRKSRRSGSSSSESEKPRSEESHWAFLSYFKYPQEIEKNAWIDNWSGTLGKPYEKVIQEFLDQGFLKKAGVKDKLAMKLRVQDLKRLLKEQGLKVSGKKEELLERYIEAQPHEAEEKALMVGDVYVCTSEGLQKVEQYAKRIADRRESADQEIRKLLAEGRIDQAVEVVQRFNQSLPRPPADYMPSKNEVKMVLDIMRVPRLTDVEVEEGRLKAAAELLWDGRISGLYPFANYARIQIERKRSIEELRGYAKEEFVTGVEILCCDDSCEKCKAVANKKYPLNRAPLIPIDGCTHEMGCRCCYTPVVD